MQKHRELETFMQDVMNQDLRAKKYQPDPRDEFKAELKHSSTSCMIARYCLHAALSYFGYPFLVQ